MGVFIEFNTVQDADAFGGRVDCSQLPEEFNAFCHHWFGSDPSPDIWACTTLVEVLDKLRESDLKKLMPRRNDQPDLVASKIRPDRREFHQLQLCLAWLERYLIHHKPRG